MDFEHELRKTHERVINTAIQGATIVILPSACLSLMRIFVIGWMNVFFIHLLVCLLTLGLFLLRKKLKALIKIQLLVGIVLIISVSGLLTFTLTGGSFVFFTLVFIPLVLYNRYYAITYTLIYLVIFYGIAVLNKLDLISPFENYDEYLDHFAIWMVHGLTYVLIFFYIGYMLNMYYLTYRKALGNSVKYANGLNTSLELLQFQNNRFTAFMDASPFHVSIKDDEKRYVYGNKAIIDRVASDHPTIIGKSTADLFPSLISKELEKSDDFVLNTNQTYNDEVKISMEDGTFVYYKLIKFPLYSQNKNQLIGAISIDITKQKQTEKDLIDSENKYRAIFEGSMDGIVFLDEDLKISDCNQAYSDLLGYSKNELIGQDYKITLKDGSFTWDNEIVDLAAKSWFDSKNIELEGLKKQGDLVHGDCAIYKLKSGDKQLIWAVVKDLEEKKKLEADVFKTMVESEEKERSRFAKELHDGLGPLLSTSLSYLHILQKESKQESTAGYIQRLNQLVKEALGSIKVISNNISPDILDKYGLVHAIRSFCEKLSPLCNSRFSIVTNCEFRVEKTIELITYRIVTELVNNTLKYANASEVNIEIQYTNGVLSLTYIDNGVGFNYPLSENKPAGFGLVNIENRLRKIGGHLNYYSKPNEGVRVHFFIKT